MRFLFLLSVSFLTAITAFSQKQFEGTIVYKLHSAEDKEDGQLTILFGKNAVRLKMLEKNAIDKQELIVRIDSGRVYTLNTEEKTFRSRKLLEKKNNAANFPARNISGFTASPLDASNNSAMGLIGGLFTGRTIIFYVADSLFYPVPDKYSSNPELLFSQGGKIALGLEIKRANKFQDDDKGVLDTLLSAEITVEATSIKWGPINESEFSIPDDYAKAAAINQYYPGLADSSMILEDSAAMMTDTVNITSTMPIPKPPSKTKTPAKPVKKAGTDKTAPIKKPE
jgi:hypothetical protein